MYEAFVTQKPERRSDGMVHFTVEFRSNDGQEPVLRSSFTDTFTEEWFKVWCLKQLEGLNRVQETAAVVTGKVDLAGVSTEPDEAVKEQREFNEKLGRLERLIRIATAGVISTDDARISTLQGELRKTAEAKPELLDR